MGCISFLVRYWVSDSGVGAGRGRGGRGGEEGEGRETYGETGRAEMGVAWICVFMMLDDGARAVRAVGPRGYELYSCGCAVGRMGEARGDGGEGRRERGRCACGREVDK
jgi:hypothetical protein